MTTETETRPTMCVCARKCEHQLSWAARAPMAKCCPEDDCTCWCHEQGMREREDGKRRSIWFAKPFAQVR